MQMKGSPYCCGVGSIGTKSDERRRESSNTAETGEETFTSGATRTASPPDCASGVREE